MGNFVTICNHIIDKLRTTLTCHLWVLSNELGGMSEFGNERKWFSYTGLTPRVEVKTTSPITCVYTLGLKARGILARIW